jgi:hypothetical protein
VKFIDEDTGFTDLAMDASDSKILLRGFVPATPHELRFQRRWTRQRHLEDDRRRQDVEETRRRRPPEGLLGRIGLDVSRSNPNILYAQMEVGASVGTWW